MIDHEKLAEYAASMDLQRRGEWIDVSGKLECIDIFLVSAVQGLGTVDAKLIVEDKKILQGKPSNPAGDLSDHLTQAYLWVLGAYEIARTLSQVADQDPEKPLAAKKEQFRQLKHQFELVRVPLAKFEAARKNPTGYSFAYPAFSPSDGTGWVIGQNQFITRRLLSDRFLSELTELP